VVFAAFDRQRRLSIALKLLCPGYGFGAFREARAMSAVSHPNVVAVYDAGMIHDVAYLTMELVRGTTLVEWTANPQTPDDVVWAMTHAGRGLAAAHAAGIIHRDFKPANVLIGRRGAIKVADFGLAAWAPPRGVEGSSSRRDRTTAPSALVGTEPYMAPESAAGQAASARSDQFSFCATLYELLAGRQLFPSGTAIDAPPGTVEHGLEYLHHTGRAGHALLCVLARGLAFDPDMRYPTMDHLLADLARAA